MIALTKLGFLNDILVGLGIEQVTALTDPGVMPFLIASGNWSVYRPGIRSTSYPHRMVISCCWRFHKVILHSLKKFLQFNA